MVERGRLLGILPPQGGACGVRKQLGIDDHRRAACSSRTPFFFSTLQRLLDQIGDVTGWDIPRPLWTPAAAIVAC